MGNKSDSCGLGVSTQYVSNAVNEVSSHNQRVRDEAKRSISFLREIDEELRVKLVTESKSVNLALKVRILILVVLEGSNVAFFRGDIRYSVSEEHNSFSAGFVESFCISQDLHRRVKTLPDISQSSGRHVLHCIGSKFSSSVLHEH